MTAKEAVYAALRRRADAEAAARAVDKRRALDFVRAPVEPGDLRQLRALLAALAQTLAALVQLPNGTARALPHPLFATHACCVCSLSRHMKGTMAASGGLW